MAHDRRDERFYRFTLGEGVLLRLLRAWQTVDQLVQSLEAAGHSVSREDVGRFVDTLRTGGLLEEGEAGELPVMALAGEHPSRAALDATAVPWDGSRLVLRADTRMECVA